MSRTAKGEFVPSNPGKYIGKHKPYYRSSWELALMRKCDSHPSILEWASEPIRIPYQNPITGKMTVYVPDFLIVYVDANGRKHTEMLEIKPAKETLTEKAKSKRDQMRLVINAAKWEAAYKWASKHGIQFRVLTEESLFRNHRK